MSEPGGVVFTSIPLPIVTKIPAVAEAFPIYEPKVETIFAGLGCSKVRSRSNLQAALGECPASPGIDLVVHLVNLSIFSLVEEPDQLPPPEVRGALAGQLGEGSRLGREREVAKRAVRPGVAVVVSLSGHFSAWGGKPEGEPKTNLDNLVFLVEVKDVGLQILDQKKLHLQSRLLLGKQLTVLPSLY